MKRPLMSRLTQADKRFILEHYNNGAGKPMLAEKYRCAPITIWWIHKRLKAQNE